MPSVHKSARVAHSAQQMFDLVADVASYPQFLPWCSGAWVLAQDAGGLTASLQISKAGFSHRFTTRNTHHAPRAIRMDLVEGPFRMLYGDWRFEPLGNGDSIGSLVALDLQFEFASKILMLTFGKTFQAITGAMVDAFVTRADKLHATR